MMEVRVTYCYENRAELSVIELMDYAVFGNWNAPFPNAVGDSVAFGQVECFEQSDLGRVMTDNFGKIVRLRMDCAEGGM